MADETLNYLEISRADLRENARRIAEFVEKPVIGVVKCDGYGVSLEEAAAAWHSCGVRMFGVSQPEEALALRQCGYLAEDILLLAPVADPFILDKLLENNVILTVSGAANAAFYAGAGGEARVHVAVDTGMGRFGVGWNDFPALRQIYATPNLRFEGIFSHFAASFEKKYDLTKRQLDRFLGAVDYLESAGCPVGMRHIAASCAALRFPETRLDAVRIGSALVGRLCAPAPVALKPVGVLRAMVVDRRRLRKGERTGYASVCRIPRDMDVAIVALGHQSGFGLKKSGDCFCRRELLRRVARVVRDYRRCPTVQWQGMCLPVVGRIGSQYTLVCAEGADIRPGDSVTAMPDDITFPFRNRKFV